MDAFRETGYRTTVIRRRWISVVLFYPALLLPLLPLLQATAAIAQTESATERLHEPDEAKEQTVSSAVDPATITGGNGLDAMGKAVGRLSATMSGYQRLKVNEVDKAQFEAYLGIRDQGAVASLAQNAAAGLKDTDGGVDASKLPDSYRQNLGLDNLSQYSKKLIESILNEVTPQKTNGAGHEFLNVFRITKDFRTKENPVSDESIPPLGEEPRESLHSKDNGKAVDVTQLDYLRGTKFTIETTVDAKTGKPVIGPDGKPVEEVKKIEHQDLAPIDFSNQDERTAGAFPGSVPNIPEFTSNSANGTAQNAAGGKLGATLAAGAAKRGSSDLPFEKIDFSGAQNLPEVLQSIGRASIAQVFGAAGMQTGPNAPLWTGQQSLAQATGLPSFGFYGATLDGASNGQPGMLINMGREVVGQQLGLPQGALIGNTSDELFTNVGERTMETVLGQLPLGTLDGVVGGDRRSLETHVGRGVLADRLNLFVSQIPLGSSSADFARGLGAGYLSLQSEPLAYDTSFNIRDSGSTAGLVAGSVDPDDYLRRIGAERLKLLDTYQPDRADAGLNLEERPDLVRGLEGLPFTTDPTASGTAPLSVTETAAAGSRATFLLDKFAFPTAAAQLLDRARGGNTDGELRFLLNDNELTGWLMVSAYPKGVDPNQASKVSRFQAADTGVFYDIGTDQVAKGLTQQNDQRSALRSYFRTGTMPTLDGATPVVRIDDLLGKAGLRSRADFEAVFRTDAPLTAFEMAGRRALLLGFGQDPADRANQLAAPAATPQQLSARLDTLGTAVSNLAGVTNGAVRDGLVQAGTVVDQLKGLVDTARLSATQATPQAWVGSLTNLYQAAQSAAGVADTHATEYRNFALALASFADGDNTQGLYALTAATASINSPYAYPAMSSLTGMITGTVPPTQAIGQFGTSVLGQFGGLGTSESQLLYDVLGAAGSQRQATPEDIRTQLKSFAHDHAASLAEAASELQLQTYGYDLDGRPLSLGDSALARQDAMAEALVALYVQGDGSPAGMKLGAKEFDAAMGIKGYQVSEDGGEGAWGIVSRDVGGAIDQVMERALGDQRMLELLTGQTNADLSRAEQQNLYLTAMTRYAAAKTGIPFNPKMFSDPDYVPTFGEINGVVGALTGRSIDEVLRTANVPIVGDFLSDQKAIQALWTGEIFNTDSSFWQNQDYLGSISRLAGQADVPPSLVQALFNKNLTADQRTAAFQDTYLQFAQQQLTPDRINGLFGLDGTAAIGGSAVSGAIGILFDRTITDKGTALGTLGASIGDSLAASTIGGSISWAWDPTTSSQRKIESGLTQLSAMTGLDPSITNLAQTAYHTFFIDGLNTNTPEGRQQLGSLVGALGSAANVPGQFVSLAASALQGDVATSLVTFAGQSYIDNQLASAGIGGVSFSNVYEAFISPLPGTERLAQTTAWNEVIVPSGLSPEQTDVGSLTRLTNPTTGETVLVDGQMADAYRDRTQQLLTTQRTSAQTNLQYAASDALLSQALGSQAGGALSLGGFTRTMIEGSMTQRLDGAIGLMSQFAGSENAELIYGAQVASDLATYFSSNDPNAVPSASLNALDGWMAGATGVPIPAGTTSALFQYANTGSTAALEAIGNPANLAASFGGFVDQGLGLPSGTTQFAAQAFQSLSEAQAAVDGLSGFVGTGELQAAQANLALTQANLVAAAVNIVFAEQFAQLDSALGLPSGMTSLLATTGITALMVPGIAFATLASSILLPGIGFMLLGGLLGGGGLFGGGTKKITRYEILWSYRMSDPAERPDPNNLRKAEMTDADKQALAQVDGKELPLKEDKSNKNLIGAYLKPSTELDRGDWPEEAWFVDQLKPGSKADPNVIAPGKNIALLTDKELPVDIFRGNTKQQFLAGAKQASKTKIGQLLGDLLTIDERLGAKDPITRAPVYDRTIWPAEIWTHDKADLDKLACQINKAYGEGQDGTATSGECGVYNDLVKNYKGGVGYDSNISLLVRWVHWQY